MCHSLPVHSTGFGMAGHVLDGGSRGSTKINQAINKTQVANNTSQNKPTQQRRRQAHSHLQACSPQRSPLTVHLGLPVCTHSSQPRYAGSNHHAPPPALAHLRWCHLAKCQVGRKARALPHTRPTVRSSMANRSAGLSKAPVHTACCATNHDEPTQPSNIQGFRANTTASSKL